MIFIKPYRDGFYRMISLLITISLILSGNISYAAVLPYMPETNQIITPGSRYNLPELIGLKFNSDSPFDFTFMVNRGDIPLTRAAVQEQVDNIGRYFLAALTLPETDLWVNLSPYEKDRILTNELAQTDLGRDMLGEDYVLKQLASSVTYPESESGKKFWEQVQARAREKLNGANVPLSVFNKVWIVPDKIRVVESDVSAAIEYAKLKVMTEEDYLAKSKNSTTPTTSSAAVMRDVVVPIIESEVNTGKHFAKLRQIYSSIVMAAWFKKKLSSTILGDIYFNQKKIKGADVNDPSIKEKIYNEYTKAFRDGVYKYVSRTVTANRLIKRQYTSGGIMAKVTPVTDFVKADQVLVQRVTERRGGRIEARQQMLGLDAGTGEVLAELPGTAGQRLSVVASQGPRLLSARSALYADSDTMSKFQDRKEQIKELLARKLPGINRNALINGVEKFLAGYNMTEQIDIILTSEFDFELFVTADNFKRGKGSTALNASMNTPEEVAESMRETQDYRDTIFVGEQALGRKFNDSEKAALWEAHQQGDGTIGPRGADGLYRGGTNSPEAIKNIITALKKAFTQEERRKLILNGASGSSDARGAAVVGGRQEALTHIEGAIDDSDEGRLISIAGQADPEKFDQGILDALVRAKVVARYAKQGGDAYIFVVGGGKTNGHAANRYAGAGNAQEVYRAAVSVANSMWRERNAPAQTQEEVNAVLVAIKARVEAEKAATKDSTPRPSAAEISNARRNNARANEEQSLKAQELNVTARERIDAIAERLPSGTILKESNADGALVFRIDFNMGKGPGGEKRLSDTYDTRAAAVAALLAGSTADTESQKMFYEDLGMLVYDSARKVYLVQISRSWTAEEYVSEQAALTRLNGFFMTEDIAKRQFNVNKLRNTSLSTSNGKFSRMHGALDREGRIVFSGGSINYANEAVKNAAGRFTILVNNTPNPGELVYAIESASGSDTVPLVMALALLNEDYGVNLAGERLAQEAQENRLRLLRADTELGGIVNDILAVLNRTSAGRHEQYNKEIEVLAVAIRAAQVAAGSARAPSGDVDKLGLSQNFVRLVGRNVWQFGMGGTVRDDRPRVFPDAINLKKIAGEADPDVFNGKVFVELIKAGLVKPSEKGSGFTYEITIADGPMGKRMGANPNGEEVYRSIVNVAREVRAQDAQQGRQEPTAMQKFLDERAAKDREVLHNIRQNAHAMEESALAAQNMTSRERQIAGNILEMLVALEDRNFAGRADGTAYMYGALGKNGEVTTTARTRAELNIHEGEGEFCILRDTKAKDGELAYRLDSGFSGNIVPLLAALAQYNAQENNVVNAAARLRADAAERRLEQLKNDKELGGIVNDLAAIIKRKGDEPINYNNYIHKLAEAVFEARKAAGGKGVVPVDVASLNLSAAFVGLVGNDVGRLGLSGTADRRALAQGILARAPERYDQGIFDELMQAKLIIYHEKYNVYQFYPAEDSNADGRDARFLPAFMSGSPEQVYQKAIEWYKSSSSAREAERLAEIQRRSEARDAAAAAAHAELVERGRVYTLNRAEHWERSIAQAASAAQAYARQHVKTPVLMMAESNAKKIQAGESLAGRSLNGKAFFVYLDASGDIVESRKSLNIADKNHALASLRIDITQDPSGKKSYSVSDPGRLGNVVPVLLAAAQLNGQDTMVEELKKVAASARAQRYAALKGDGKLGLTVIGIEAILARNGYNNPALFNSDIQKLAQAVYDARVAANGGKTISVQIASLGLSPQFAKFFNDQNVATLDNGGVFGRGIRGTDSTGGLDFASANNIETVGQSGGLKFSQDKTKAFLMSGKVAGFRLATTKLTF